MQEISLSNDARDVKKLKSPAMFTSFTFGSYFINLNVMCVV